MMLRARQCADEAIRTWPAVLLALRRRGANAPIMWSGTLRRAEAVSGDRRLLHPEWVERDSLKRSNAG
jgi:hypothetical protein